VNSGERTGGEEEDRHGGEEHGGVGEETWRGGSGHLLTRLA
jgi:hypothetical protein